MTFNVKKGPWPDSGGTEMSSWIARELSTCANVPVPLSSLVGADSLRTIEADMEHVRALADIAEKLSPILVHGQSGIVVDGLHRLYAAKIRRDTMIDALSYPGSLDDAFVLAINLNSHHGLPLIRAERANAAMRILLSHAQWRDRMIADITGLAAGTISSVRQDSRDGNSQPATTGKDLRASTDRQLSCPIACAATTGRATKRLGAANR